MFYYYYNFLFFMVDIIQEDLNLEVWTMVLEEGETVKLTIDGPGIPVEKKLMRGRKVWTRKHMRRLT